MRPRRREGADKGVHEITKSIWTLARCDVSTHYTLFLCNLMKKLDLDKELRYVFCIERDGLPPSSSSMRLPRMNSAIRVFALLVAIAGLAAASFAPAATQTLSRHASMSQSGPGPDLPGPPPCSETDTCFVQSASIR